MSEKQKPGQTPTNAEALRKRAEQQAQTSVPASMSAQTPEEIQQVLHELGVQQIELEMQNEELCIAQVQIDAERARYFDLYDLAPVGYCTLSEQGLIMEANLTAAMLLGTDRSALIKMAISRFILKKDQEIYYLHRKRLFENGEPQNCNLRMLKKDGTPFWASLSATIAQTEEGAPVCRLILSDITERKQAEEQHRFHAQIVEDSSVIAAYHDKDLNTVWINKAYQKATGLSLEEIRGKKCYQVWNLQKPCRSCPVLTAIETGESAANELTPDNQDHWPVTQGYWRSEATPVRDELGAIIGAIEFAFDITERKQAEQALHLKITELELFHNLTVGRELKMIELKKEINGLLKQAGKPEKFKILDE